VWHADALLNQQRSSNYMRTFKLIGTMIAVLAFMGLAIASSASAEITLWQFLPGAAGTLFSGSSGKATLQIKGSGTITCKESKLTEKESEITSTTLGLAILSFSGCKAFGLAAKSLGDAAGVILVHLHLHNCTLVGGGRGVILEPLPVHIEIPSTALLITVRGSFVAELKAVGAQPTKSWELVVAQKEGVQSIEKCEGGTALTLESEVDASGKFIQSAEEAEKGTIEFATAQEAMA